MSTNDNLQIIGLVSNVEGDVIAVDAQGNERALNQGDSVFLADTLITSTNGLLALNNANFDPLLNVPRSTRVYIDESVVPGLFSEDSLVDENAVDISTLQQLVEEGLFEELEDTAAGGSQAASSSLTEAQFMIDSGNEGEVTAGLETSTSNDRPDFEREFEAANVAQANSTPEEPVVEEPAAETVAETPPAVEEPAPEEPAPEEPTPEEPTPEEPVVETPPVAEEPTTEEPVVETPPVVEEPTSEEPVTETPPAVEEPTSEEPVVETPPAVEEPTPEEPVVETPPVVEETTSEEPVVETPPVVEETTPEEPVVETPPVVEEPTSEEPVVETPPEVEEPTSEEPVVEEPTPEEPVVGTPPMVEEPTPEEPVVETPPVVEEPTPEEPVVETPPLIEEPTPEEPVVETPPVVEEPTPEEPVVETPPVIEEPTPEEPVVETPPVVEEPTPEEPVVETPPVVEEPTPEEPVAEAKSVILLEESFENLQPNKGWHIENGDVTGDHGVVWDTGKNGLEIQNGIVSKSSDGQAHAELDAKNNVNMSTEVNLNGASNITLTIDVKPRDGGSGRGNKDTSDASIEFDGKTVQILSDSKGNLTYLSDDPTVSVEMSEAEGGNGWTTFEITYQEIENETPILRIEGTGNDDSYGALIDNIKVMGEQSVAEENTNTDSSANDKSAEIGIVPEENQDSKDDENNAKVKPEKEEKEHQDNGHGNGDDTAPGRSAEKNNAENSNDPVNPEPKSPAETSTPVLASENFENGASGWSNNAVTESTGNATNFLGQFGGTNGEQGVSKTFDFGAEQAGQTVSIEFDMYEIDSWDDEKFNVFINDEMVSSEYLSHQGRSWSSHATDEQDGGTAIDNLGSSGAYYLDNDEAHHYTLEAKVDENGQIKLGFGSTLNSGTNDESWGIDNVVITAGDEENNTQVKSEKEEKEHQDNGHGNGDDTAPGGSADNNNAENASEDDNPFVLTNFLTDDDHSFLHGDDMDDGSEFEPAFEPAFDGFDLSEVITTESDEDSLSGYFALGGDEALEESPERNPNNQADKNNEQSSDDNLYLNDHGSRNSNAIDSDFDFDGF